MTIEIGILFAVLGGMAYLFFTEKLPVDLTAFLGLVVFTLCGYVTPGEAFTGFSSSAVITMLSIFFVSAALFHTGIADMIAVQVNKMIGGREIPLQMAIMIVAGVLSAFMNNIAATAVLLPAVASIAKKSGVSASRLFIPLSFGAILGGTTTLVGTPPNILAAEMLEARGMEPFKLFDFTALGLVLLGGGVIFMITVGRHLLPKTDISDAVSPQKDLARMYRLEQNLFSIKVPFGSKVDGKTLGDLEIGSALGVQVVGIVRDGKKQLAPSGNSVIFGGDTLLVKGRYGQVQDLFRMQGVEVGEAGPGELMRGAGKVGGLIAKVVSESSLEGKTLRDIHFRKKYGVVVIAVRRGEELIDRNLAGLTLAEGDELFAIGPRAQVDSLALEKDIAVSRLGKSAFQDLDGHIFLLRVPSDSEMAGVSVAESHVSETMGLTIAGIIRGEEMSVAVSPEEKILAGDELLVTGEPERVRKLLALGSLRMSQDVTESVILTDDVGLVEATVAPRSAAAGRSIADLHFQDRFGLQVLALWREGTPIHSGLAHIPLKFGDALLLQGSWPKIRLFGRVRDFVTLSPYAQEPRRTTKAPFALGALLLMIAIVVSGWQPIHVAAFTAASLVVLFGAITMEEAYRAVEWRAIFLVAAILPVGIAMERTGAAALLSSGVTDFAGPYGPYAVLAGLVLLSSALSQALDGAPAVVLLTPVAIQAAELTGISPYPVMMGVGLAASAAFMTPFSHKANLLVMGAGGYKFLDYLKVGTPLTIILLAVLVWLVPYFFPF